MSVGYKSLLQRLVARYGPLHGLDRKSKFTRIYHGGRFGGQDSKSGPGSSLQETKIIRKELPLIVQRFGVKSILDAPCGDWHWMRTVNLGVDSYVGVDIVDELIANNIAFFGRAGFDFRCLDIITDLLPKVDMILSRDCLVHLRFSDAFRVLENFKRSGATYLLVTTFPGIRTNTELAGASRFWRPLNMERPPFNFPPPIICVNEHCTEVGGRFADKSLGLWEFTSINNALDSFAK